MHFASSPVQDPFSAHSLILLPCSLNPVSQRIPQAALKTRLQPSFTKKPCSGGFSGGHSKTENKIKCNQTQKSYKTKNIVC